MEQNRLTNAHTRGGLFLFLFAQMTSIPPMDLEGSRDPGGRDPTCVRHFIRARDLVSRVYTLSK